ncbi:MAG: YadA-like family protein [Dialister sp.]|nr:YadA-like family protein [Dialister sp.]
MKPIQYDPLEPTQIMAGFGTYRSSNAIALGIAHYNNESTMMHADVSYAGGSNHHIMANLGVTWKVGSGATEEAVMESYRKGPVSSVYALQNEVRDLKAENSQMRKDNEEMRKDNEELKQQLAKVMEKLGMA